MSVAAVASKIHQACAGVSLFRDISIKLDVQLQGTLTVSVCSALPSPAAKRYPHDEIVS